MITFPFKLMVSFTNNEGMFKSGHVDVLINDYNQDLTDLVLWLEMVSGRSWYQSDIAEMVDTMQASNETTVIDNFIFGLVQ